MTAAAAPPFTPLFLTRRAICAQACQTPETAATVGEMRHFPFRMPLHGQGKTLRALDPHGLDRAVRRYGLNREPGGQLVDPLAMQRIHANVS